MLVRRYVFTAAPLLTADIVGLAVSAVIALMAVHLLFTPRALNASAIGLEDVIVLLPLLFAYWCCGLYPGIARHPVIELRQITRLNTTLYLAIVAALWITHASAQWGAFFSVAWLASVAAVSIMRAVARRLCARRSWWGYPTVVIGSGALALEAFNALRATPRSGLRPCAIVDVSCPLPDTLPDAPVALVALPETSRARLSEILEMYRNRFPHLIILSSVMRMSSLWRDSGDCGGLATTEVRNKLLLPWPRFVKRSTDLAAATAVMALGLPLFTAIALAVKVSSPGPVFFGHRRLGRNGCIFKAWKFRTMRRDADAVLKHLLDTNPEARREWEIDHKLRNDPRVTRIGNLLRKTSLDELPQLWNVLNGDMSLVGPRPIVAEEISKYGDIFRLYSEVLPGITGLWQVSGRNNTTYPERVDLDHYYVRNWSPWLDAHILARTVKTLLFREGAY